MACNRNMSGLGGLTNEEWSALKWTSCPNMNFDAKCPPGYACNEAVTVIDLGMPVPALMTYCTYFDGPYRPCEDGDSSPCPDGWMCSCADGSPAQGTPEVAQKEGNCVCIPKAKKFTIDTSNWWSDLTNGLFGSTPEPPVVEQLPGGGTQTTIDQGDEVVIETVVPDATSPTGKKVTAQVVKKPLMKTQNGKLLVLAGIGVGAYLLWKKVK